MKKRAIPGITSWTGVGACCFSLLSGLYPASAAVIAQTFEQPLAPNTLNWGPDVQAVHEYQKKLYRFQWRLAPLGVDLDSNGTSDLTFTGTESNTNNTMRVSLTGRNEVWATLYGMAHNRIIDALVLRRGSEAGPSLSSANTASGWFNDADAPEPALLTSGIGQIPYKGNFLPDVPFEQKFLGVRFERDGAMHYGWVGISGYANIGQEIYIHAWAYESQPETAITIGQIPEPGAWLLASAGGLLAALRRQRKSGA